MPLERVSSFTRSYRKVRTWVPKGFSKAAEILRALGLFFCYITRFRNACDLSFKCPHLAFRFHLSFSIEHAVWEGPISVFFQSWNGSGCFWISLNYLQSSHSSPQPYAPVPTLTLSPQVDFTRLLIIHTLYSKFELVGFFSLKQRGYCFMTTV